jgi:hypothetical protein
MPQIYRSDDHDTIVRKFAEAVEHHNPGRYRIVIAAGEAAASANADILLFEGEATKPVLSIEIETAATVSEEQATTRWLRNSQSGPLEVVVPKGFDNRAKALFRKHKIKARLIQY